MSASSREVHDAKGLGAQLLAQESNPIHLLVIDRRPLIRACLVSHLRSYGRLDATGVSEVKRGFADLDVESIPDIILACIGDGERFPANPSEVLPDNSDLRGVPIVVLSNNRPASQVFEMLRGGIRGFIPTSVGIEVAVQAIRLVNAGGTFVPETCLHSLPEPAGPAGGSSPIFTHRQLQVVEAIRQGKPNKIIAYELNMCESTVKVHVRTIMKKLRARNRTQVAFLYAAGSDTLGQPFLEAAE